MRSKSLWRSPHPQPQRLQHERMLLSKHMRSSLTRASKTNVSKVSLSEFSIMMLKRASNVSWRNCIDTEGQLIVWTHQTPPTHWNNYDLRRTPNTHLAPNTAYKAIRDLSQSLDAQDKNFGWVNSEQRNDATRVKWRGSKQGEGLLLPPGGLSNPPPGFHQAGDKVLNGNSGKTHLTHSTHWV